MERLIGFPSPFGMNTPATVLQFEVHNIGMTTMHSWEVLTLAELCGDILRGIHTDGRWMGFPAPEFLRANRDGTKT